MIFSKAKNQVYFVLKYQNFGSTQLFLFISEQESVVRSKGMVRGKGYFGKYENQNTKHKFIV